MCLDHFRISFIGSRDFDHFDHFLDEAEIRLFDVTLFHFAFGALNLAIGSDVMVGMVLPECFSICRLTSDHRPG